MKKTAFLIDLLFIVIFVAIGRHAHEHGITVRGMASTFWPFGSGLLVGWLLLLILNRSGSTPKNGAVIVCVTVTVGMLLRVIAGQGTALTFILVALTFLSLFLIGWRALFSIIQRRFSNN